MSERQSLQIQQAIYLSAAFICLGFGIPEGVAGSIYCIVRGCFCSWKLGKLEGSKQ